MPKFVAQSLWETRISEDHSRVELAFSDLNGKTRTISLPIGAVRDLIPVLGALADNAAAAAKGARLTKMPTQWAVGTAQHERLVLLKFDDDPPYGLDLEIAESLWREMRAEAESVSRMKAPAVQ
ncbi:MAG TPA: hypothetical protein VJ740_04095 [Hyphomicrobiaceae bacterium]|nr:hypothetical protein [Hyphomicrobiaceae bacterium]